MNRVEFKTVAVANQSGAMEQRNHFKNGDSPKTQRSRRNFFVVVCFALLAAFSGCDKDKDKDDGKSVDPKLVGKWEMQSITSNGEESNEIYNAGVEFTKSTIKVFIGGELVEREAEAYTIGNKLYHELSTAVFTWQVSGSTLTVTYKNEGNDDIIEISKKVTKFSWE